jgi:phosphate transport system ATP-binding protein
MEDVQILKPDAGKAVTAPTLTISAVPTLIEVRNLNVWYETSQALHDVSYDLKRGEILAFIGPSGCGKTTALKCLNRMLDSVRGIKIEGSIQMEGQDIYSPNIDPPEYRQRFGWVAQMPNPFAETIYENVAWGARIHGLTRDQAELDAHVETCLRRADLWDEVKDILHSADGTSLSGGQQQRLCIARALGTKPDVLLMDEPTGSVDPIAARQIENLMLALRKTVTILVITHSMMGARRTADRVAVFHLGRLVEIGATHQIFSAPVSTEAKNFVSGRVG